AGLGGYAGARRAAPGEPADDELDLPSGPVFRRVRPRAGGRPVRSGRDFDAPTTLHRLRIARVAGLAVLVFLGYMALAYFVFPSATVVVTPHATYLPVELTVRVDPDAVEVDERRGVIPAQIREAVVRDTLSKPTTGRRRDTESVAAGEVILRNRTAQPLIAPRGTRVRTADGVAFVTSSEVLIPPTLNVGDRPVPGEARVLAVAELGGMAGNVSALAIAAVEGPFAGVLDAVNPRPFTGGAEREVALVATKDRDELLTTLRERLQSSAVEELKRQRGDQRSLVVWSPESGNLEILEKKFSAGADERAANLSLDMSLRTRGTSFANADLERLLAAALARTPAARDVSVDRIYVTATNLLSEQLGVVTLHVRAVGEVVARIDRGAVRDRVTGRSIDEGLAALGRMPGVAAYAASHDPADTANFPRLGFRIDVKIETPAPAPAS
ncbi:MAG: baseplate J/gp47 family protein, partial [Actinobacteria bacterium]|nr:baseplate J/gp47 family protein [Actinomycetota bacterium]